MTAWFSISSVLLLTLLAACRSVLPSHQVSAVDQKKASNQGTIHAGDFLASPENCGMVRGMRPVYPQEAKRAHIEGVVKLDLVITKTGEVGELHVISGNPTLVPAAIAAVRQWRYAPCRLNGEPIEIKTQVDVPFCNSAP
jgi:TonB family protein